jgi:hypothetical protein
MAVVPEFVVFSMSTIVLVVDDTIFAAEVLDSLDGLTIKQVPLV